MTTRGQVNGQHSQEPLCVFRLAARGRSQMARKTSIQAEADHIFGIFDLIGKLRDIPNDRKLRLTLKSGRVIEGRIKRGYVHRHLVEIDRDAAARNSDLASGEVTIVERGEFNTFDLLDVKQVEVAQSQAEQQG